MQCREVRHIIDQYINREIPKEALGDLKEHFTGCEECSRYLDESLKIQNVISKSIPTETNDAFFEKLHYELEESKARVPSWRALILNPIFRPLAFVSAVLVFALISSFTIYTYSMGTSESFSDKKMEAMMKQMPEGAVLMKTPQGENIIFLDPALDADQSADDIMRELNEVLNESNRQQSDDFNFASSD